MQTLLTRWLKVYQDEIQLFLWSALLLLFIRSSNIIFNNFAETAFLKRFGVEYLPFVTAINAVTTFVIMGLLTGVMVRISSTRLLYQALVFSGCSVGALRFVVPLGIDLLYPVLYILKTQYDVLLAFLFWNLANDLFSTRQAKRIFPLITAGGLVGAIVGSFGTPVLAKAISANNLMLAYTCTAVAGAWTARRIGSLFPSEVVTDKTAPKKNLGLSILSEVKSVVPILRDSTLAKTLLFLTLLPNIISPIVGYQFSFAIDQTFASEGGMLGFFSYFRGAQNIIALVISLFVGRIYGRFGLPVALLFHPANYGVVFLAFLTWFGIYSAMYCGISVGVLRTTINAPATNALYGLFPMRHRALIRPFLRGTVVRVGILVGSGFILLSQPLMHPRYLSLVALVFVAGWIASAWVLKRRYSEILLDLLTKESLDLHSLEEEDATEIFTGTNLGGQIVERFAKSSGRDALWYARLLQSLGVSDLDRHILEKLKTEDDCTRIELLSLLSPQAGEPALHVFRDLVDPSKPDLMIALARTAKRVCADMPSAVAREIFERAVNPEVKACFLPGMMDQDPDTCRALVTTWLDSDRLPERRAGVVAAGESGRREYLEPLRKMLGTETDPSVIPLILKAWRALEEDGLNEAALPFLSHGSEPVRLAALGVLEIEDEETALRVIRLLGDTSDSIREQAIQKLESTEYPVVPLLVDALATGGRRVREAIFRLAGSLDVKDLDVFRYCSAGLERAYRNLAQMDAVSRLPESPERDLLVEYLDQRKDLRVHNILRGLAAHDRSGQMRAVWHGLSSLDSRQRANSLEALESLLDASLTKIMLPLLENTPVSERLAFGAKHFGIQRLDGDPRAVFSHLLSSEDRITLLLALGLARKQGIGHVDLADLGKLAGSEDGEVRKLAERVIAGHAEQPDEKESAVGDTLSVPEKVLHLKEIDILESLSVRELAAVAQIAEEVEFPEGEIIAREGDPGDRLGLLIGGEIVVTQCDEEGCTHELTRFQPGESFGELTILADSTAPRTLRAAKQSRVLVISKQDFQEMLREYPEIALGICKQMGRRLLSLLDRVKEYEGHSR